MPIVAPGPIDAAPALPDSTQDEPTFDAMFEAFLAWVAGPARTQFSSAAAITYGNAQEAFTAASTATDASIDAAAAAAQSLAAANFKGEWPGLTGQLLRPACVKNDGRFWMLLADLPDVTASEPADGNAHWTSLDSGTAITQRLTVADAVVSAVIGVKYLIAAAGVKLVLPTAGLFKGAYSGFRLVVAYDRQTVDFGAKFRGQSAGERKLRKGFGLDVNWEDSTDGWV